MSDSSKERYVVGYALAEKKQLSFMQTSLIEHSRQRGIDLIKLDPSKSLLDQGNKLDCIIHKLYDVAWKENLREFREKFPGVPVVDSPESIERLRNRVSMLEVITQLGFPRFGVPKQVVVTDPEVLSGGGALGGELKFPVIAKPLEADGSAKSHEMFLIYDEEGMKKIVKAPIVLQEFVNHGGVIFKVYVVGDYVQCVKRKSLPDISQEKMVTGGSLPFSQISNLTAYQEEDKKKKKKKKEEKEYGEEVELPPLSFLTGLAKAMRESMGLSLFNFDVIRDASDDDRYLVIDINYFPGYAKMPSYEPILTDFFWDMVTNKKKNQV